MMFVIAVVSAIAIVYISHLFEKSSKYHLQENQNKFDLKIDDSMEFYKFEKEKYPNGIDDDENRTKEIELCDIYLCIHPESTYALERRAHAYFVAKKYHSTISDLKILMEKEPNKYMHFALCAKSYAYLGEFDVALKMIEKFSTDEAFRFEYYITYAHIHELSGQYEIAIENYTKAAELRPDSPAPYFRRAETYKLMNKIEESEQDMKKSDELWQVIKEKHEQILNKKH